MGLLAACVGCCSWILSLFVRYLVVWCFGIVFGLLFFQAFWWRVFSFGVLVDVDFGFVASLIGLVLNMGLVTLVLFGGLLLASFLLRLLL